MKLSLEFSTKISPAALVGEVMYQEIVFGGRDCNAMHFFALHFVSFLVAVEHSSEIGRQWRVSYLARTGRDPSQRAFSLLPLYCKLLVSLVTSYLRKTG